MSEAIALSSPSGRMSKRARIAAQKRLGTALFGSQGLQQATPVQPSEKESLLSQATRLRDLAARGMSPRKYIKEAERLEAMATQIRTNPARHNPLETVTYVLPSYWASYLINGDDSGIDAKEKAQADAFLKRNNLPDPVDVGESYFSHHNDAGTLAGDVAEYTFLIDTAKANPRRLLSGSRLKTGPLLSGKVLPDFHKRRLRSKYTQVKGQPFESRSEGMGTIRYRRTKENPKLPVSKSAKVSVYETPKRGTYYVLVKQPGHTDLYKWDGHEASFLTCSDVNRWITASDTKVKNVPDALFDWIKGLFCKSNPARSNPSREWSISDISKPIRMRSNILEFTDRNGESHVFEIIATKQKIVFGGYTNTGFIESGYLPRESDESLDDSLTETLEDLQAYYNDGPRYVSRIVVNQRM